jgi:hypothetical protein
MNTSGDRASWLTAVADQIMDGGTNPPSIDQLYLRIPGHIVTGINDGHAANFWAALCETAIAERNDLTARKLALLIDFRNIPSDRLQIYGLEDKTGRLKGIQTYKRAKGQDIKRQEALEQGFRDPKKKKKP